MKAESEAEPKAELLQAQAGRAQAEESQRQVEEHFHQLVARVRDYALYLLDAKGRVLRKVPGRFCASSR